MKKCKLNDWLLKLKILSHGTKNGFNGGCKGKLSTIFQIARFLYDYKFYFIFCLIKFVKQLNIKKNSFTKILILLRLFNSPNIYIQYLNIFFLYFEFKYCKVVFVQWIYESCGFLITESVKQSNKNWLIFKLFFPIIFQLFGIHT